MLEFWERKDEARPDFSTIVTTLSSYLETTSDYLDLTLIEKEKAVIDDTTQKTVLEDRPGHSITRFVSNPNDYYVAGV